MPIGRTRVGDGRPPKNPHHDRGVKLFRGLHPTPKYLGDTPRLCDASARNERRLGIEHLTDRTNASVAEMSLEPLEKCARSIEIVRIDAQPRIDKRSD